MQAVAPEELDAIRLYLQRQHALGSSRFRAAIEAQLARNQSNIDLYAFPRDVYMVKMRYEFK